MQGNCCSVEKRFATKGKIRRLRSHVGLVFQDASTQLFAATVYQELSFGPFNLDLPEASVRSRVEEILQTSIAELKDKPTHFLSGGEKEGGHRLGVDHETRGHHLR